MMCEYWHHMEVYEVQFGIYISSYEVYRTGKPCNIGRICTPMVYIPANTAELPCPFQVIQRIILYPKLHFIIFSYMMSAFALLIFYLSSAMPWTVSHRFLPAPSGIPSAARSLCLSRKSFVVAGSSEGPKKWKYVKKYLLKPRQKCVTITLRRPARHRAGDIVRRCVTWSERSELCVSAGAYTVCVRIQTMHDAYYVRITSYELT